MSNDALKVLLQFSSSCLCESGFSSSATKQFEVLFFQRRAKHKTIVKTIVSFALILLHYYIIYSKYLNKDSLNPNNC